MPPFPPALELLLRKYPQCQPLLEAFAPLLDAREKLVQNLPAPAPEELWPDLDVQALSMGKPWLAPEKALLPLYLDDAFLQKAPTALITAAAKGLPQQKTALERVRGLFKANPDAGRDLASRGLLGLLHRSFYWADKFEQDKQAAALLCLHMGGTAARRVARHAVRKAAEAAAAVSATASAPFPLEAWDKGYCPLCGNQPHAGFLHEKEGRRSLQCGLCGHIWRFSRTVCPVCDDPSPDGRLVFFLEDDPLARAEACTKCRTYLLMPDVRAVSDSLPLELVLLCLMPLDMHLQSENYASAANLRKR